MSRKTMVCALMAISLATLVQAQPQVDFVTSSIVRVRWSANGELAGNGTGACTWKPQQVEVTSQETATSHTYSSETLTVQVLE